MKEGGESEGGLRRATPTSHHPHHHLNLLHGSSAMNHVVAGDKVKTAVNSSATATGPTVGPSDVAGGGSLPLPFLAQQQAAVAAGLFRMGGLGGLVSGSAALPLPALMASLQAAAGVGVLPLGAHLGRNPAGLPGLLTPASGYTAANLFSPGVMSAQQSAQLLHSWSKLASQLAGSAESSGLEGSPSPSNKERATNYTAGLLLHGPPTPSDDGSSQREKLIKSAQSGPGRRPKTGRLDLDRRHGKDQHKLDDLMIEPPDVSPGGQSITPPSLNGSNGGGSKSTGHDSSGSGSLLGGQSGRKSRNSGAPSGADPSRDKIFSCSICQRTFGYKHVLQNHERTHTGEKPFECKQCGKRFTRDHHLKTHMRLHTGEKPYNCTHCDRQFVQVANLRRHLRVHTGERPYACELCTSRFSDSNQLKAHMLIHKGEKPFECQRCAGRFRRRHHLMHHKCPREHFIDSAPATKRSRLAADEESEPPPTPSSYPSDDLMDDEPLDSRSPSTDPEHLALTVAPPRGSRKPRETRRLIRLAPALHVVADRTLPEQTEPEDLSMPSQQQPAQPAEAQRIRHASTFSAGSAGGWSAPGSIDLASEAEDDDEAPPSDDEQPLRRSPGPMDLVRAAQV